jgi:hypothetical protein
MVDGEFRVDTHCCGMQEAEADLENLRNNGPGDSWVEDSVGGGVDERDACLSSGDYRMSVCR